MIWEDIRRNNADDVKAWVSEQTEIPNELALQTALLFDDVDEGFTVLEAAAEKHGVPFVGQLGE